MMAAVDGLNVEERKAAAKFLNALIASVEWNDLDLGHAAQRDHELRDVPGSNLASS
ncbi:hypothetical protein D3C74_473590 [compost metagenome]